MLPLDGGAAARAPATGRSPQWAKDGTAEKCGRCEAACNLAAISRGRVAGARFWLRSRLHELEREPVLGVRLVHAGVGVPVARVVGIAKEAVFSHQPEAGLPHLVANDLFVDAVQTF